MCEHEVFAFVVLSAAFEKPKIVRALEQVSASEMGTLHDTVDCFLQLSRWKKAFCAGIEGKKRKKKKGLWQKEVALNEKAKKMCFFFAEHIRKYGTWSSM